MARTVSIRQSARYVYPGAVVPIKSHVNVLHFDPQLVPYQNGAIGFDFMKLVKVRLKTGEVFRHALPIPGTYYWGQEINIDDLEDSPDLASIEKETTLDRFVLTSWGGLIPLQVDDEAVPYPQFAEIPLDMRLK